MPTLLQRQGLATCQKMQPAAPQMMRNGPAVTQVGTAAATVHAWHAGSLAARQLHMRSDVRYLHRCNWHVASGRSRQQWM
jgi:hypothetical protein